MASERQEDVCILDTEASPEHLSRGTAQYADVMLVVVEPYFKSLETGRRMAALAKDLGLGRVALIANKMRDRRDLDAVGEFAARNGLEVGGVIPLDASMQGAERAGRSPFDFAPETPAVVAIERVARRFVEGEGEGADVLAQARPSLPETAPAATRGVGAAVAAAVATGNGGAA